MLGSGRIAAIGTNGGFMGHAMLATGKPVAVAAGAEVAQRLGEEWPRNAALIWRVPTVEVCRARSGLHRSEILVHVDPTGRLLLVGEILPCGEVLGMEQEDRLDVWQAPPALRASFCTATMEAVLRDMMSCEADWSLGTALRAVFKPALLSEAWEAEELLENVRESWEAAPICTSVPIVFWQRYLCRATKGLNISAAESIRRWMPLAADRCLPGDLVTALRGCAWTRVRHLGVASL